jgi:hypothetical protein
MTEPQFIPTMFNEPYAFMEIMNKDADPWPNVKEYDVCMYASHSNMSFHLGNAPDAAARLSLTPTDVMFYNDFWMTNQMVMRGIQLQEAPVGDNTPYQVTQQVSDMKGYDPWGTYIKITLSNGQQGFQVLDSQKVPQITLSTTTGRIHANSNDEAGDPSYSWSNNSNLGMYHYHDDAIGFASLGLDSARIHSHGRLVLSNQTLVQPGSNYVSLYPTMRQSCNVEIRFASESNDTRSTITLYSGNRDTLHIGKSTSNAFMYTCNNNLDIGTNFQSHIFIDPAGQIGLKTQLPTTHLVINNGALPLSNPQLQIQNTANLSTQNSLIATIKANATGLPNDDYFAFGYNSNVPTVRLNSSSGDPVKLQFTNTPNTSNIEFRFQAESNFTQPSLTFYDINSNVLKLGKSTSNAYMYTCNNNLDIGTNFQSHIFIDPSGQIGFKTQLPTAHMIVNNGTLPLSNPELQIQNTSSPSTHNALYAAIKTGSTGATTCNYCAFGYRSNVPTLLISQSNDPLTIHMNGSEIARFQASNGFFGLFSNAPAYQLDLVGSARVSSNLFLTQTSRSSLAINTLTPSTAQIHVEVPAAPRNAFPQSNAGLFIGSSTGGTIGTTASNHAIAALHARNANSFVSLSSTSNTTYQSWTMGIDTADSQRFKISQSNNTTQNALVTINGRTSAMGLGTTNPNARFLLATNSSFTSQQGVASSSSRLYNQTIVDDSYTGYVGVSKLVNLPNTVNATRWLGIGYAMNSHQWSNCGEIKTSDNIESLVFTFGNDQRFIMDPSGKLGVKLPINTLSQRISAPAYEIDVVGTIKATTDVITTSDRRLKSNITPISESLDKLNSLTGYTFNKTGEDPSRRFAGLVAQEVESVLPEAIYKDSEGYLSVSYGNVTALLVQAIKELSARLTALEEKVTVA